MLSGDPGENTAKTEKEKKKKEMDEFTLWDYGIVYFKQLRRMFYLVTPNESCFENVNEVPHYIDESNSVFLTFLLTESIISFIVADGIYRINDGITSSSAGLLSRLPLMLVKSVHLATYKWVHNNFQLLELPWNSPWTWFLTFLLVDLGYYWFHRMAHEVNILWAAHQVHHSSEDYNLSTALRQSVFQTYTSWIFYLPLALAIPTSVFIVHDELNILFQFWLHTQYIRTLGPLDYILNTPRHHSVHHGRNPYCIDKNYAGVLIIWDRLFGTFQAEQDEVAYGLVTRIGTFEPLEIQLFYFKHIWERIQNGENALSVLLKAPSWRQGILPLENRKEVVPPIEFPVKKYNPRLPLWADVYILFHFLTMVGFFQFLLSSQHLMSQWSVLMSLLFIGFSLSCFGRLFDKRWYAPFLEIIRCGFVFILTATLIQKYIPRNLSYAVYSLQFFHLASIIPWIICIKEHQKQS